MSKQITLEEMIAQAEAAKREYMEILHSGMFFEWFPQLSGSYEIDEIKWNKIYLEILENRQK